MPLFKTHCFLFILLALATIVLHSQFRQYEQTGPDILGGQWNLNNSQYNRIELFDGELALTAADPKGVYTRKNLPPVPPGTVLLVSADVKCTSVIPGDKPWNRARVLLVQNDGTKDRWDLPATVVSLTGTHPWTHYQAAFPIDNQTQTIGIIAELSQSTGRMQVKNLRVYPVIEKAAFSTVQAIVLSAWGVFFLLLTGSLLLIRTKTWLFHGMLLAVLIFIISGTMLPADLKILVSDTVKAYLDAESDAFKAVVPWNLDKAGHALFFFILGLLLGPVMANVSAFQTIIVILMLAAGTEIAQLYVAGRTPLLSDIVIDAAGGFTGAMLIWLSRIAGNKIVSSSEKPGRIDSR